MKMFSAATLFTVVIMLSTELSSYLVSGNPDAKRLYDDLLSNYNRLIRPVGNNTDKLTVKIALRLSQLIDIDERNQIMTTNVWLRQEWTDYKLTWSQEKYGGVDALYVPSQQIWLPDIVLYNNADGNYQVTLMTKATLHPNGSVVWEPPAIYKSSCTINVEYFPFDEQLCSMKFGSWTYDGYEVDLVHINERNNSNVVVEGMELLEYYRSVEWDVLAVPAQRNEKFYPCCSEPYPDITFNITIRRKTLFYTVNLIIPCVGISFLTVLVFYLPSDSGEKVTLCISILLSLTVFFLLLAEIIPPTSLVVPLIGKYLLFTMILVTLSICVTVGVLNVHFRSATTHKMSPWMRRVFLSILPRLLFMTRPSQDRDQTPKVVVRTCNGVEVRDYDNKASGGNVTGAGGPGGPGEQMNYVGGGGGGHEASDILAVHDSSDQQVRHRHKHSEEVRRAIEGVLYIEQHLRNDDDNQSVKEDWKYVAMVLDRLFLWIFTIACIVGTVGIIMQAPTLYDDRRPIDQDRSNKF